MPSDFLLWLHGIVRKRVSNRRKQQLKLCIGRNILMEFLQEAQLPGSLLMLQQRISCAEYALSIALVTWSLCIASPTSGNAEISIFMYPTIML